MRRALTNLGMFPSLLIKPRYATFPPWLRSSCITLLEKHFLTVRRIANIVCWFVLFLIFLIEFIRANRSAKPVASEINVPPRSWLSQLPYSPGHKHHQKAKVQRLFFNSIRSEDGLLSILPAARPPPSSIANAVLSFMNRLADVNNAKFCAESDDGCVGGFWKQLHGVAIYDIFCFFVFLPVLPVGVVLWLSSHENVVCSCWYLKKTKGGRGRRRG